MFKDAPPSLEDDNIDLFNGDFSGTLKISDTKTKMENVPISSPYSDHTPVMEDVSFSHYFLSE